MGIINRCLWLILLLTAFQSGNASDERQHLLNQLKIEEDQKSISLIIRNLVQLCKSDTACLEKTGLAVKKKGNNHFAAYLREAALPFIMAENFTTAIRYIQRSANLYQSIGQHHKLPQLYNLLAEMYGGKSQMDSAMFFVNKALSSWTSLGEKYEIWKGYYTRSTIYENLENTDASIRDLEYAYEIVKDGQSRMDKGFVLFYLVNRYGNLPGKADKYFSSLKDYIEFKQESRPLTEDFHLEVNVFENPEEGIKMLESYLKSSQKAGNEAIIGISYRILGDLYMGKENYSLAIENYRKSAEITEKNEFDYLLKGTYLRMYEVYKKTNQNNLAIEALERVRLEEEKIYQKEQRETILELEKQYETEKKDREIAEKALLIQKKNTLLLAISSFVLALLILASVAWLFLRKQSKFRVEISLKETELQQKRIQELESQNKLLGLQSLIEGQELERLRIARDLHDGIGGLLTTVKAHLNAMHSESNALSRDQILEKANELIKSAYDELHRVSHNLVPQSISLSGLTGAIEDLAEHLEAQGVHCELILDNIPQNLNNAKSIMIFRIVQEILNNIIRHSGANFVILQMIMHDNSLHILIEDNGCGFDIEDKALMSGHGLKNIQWRINYLKGDLELESKENVGTTFSIHIPVSKEEINLVES